MFQLICLAKSIGWTLGAFEKVPVFALFLVFFRFKMFCFLFFSYSFRFKAFVFKIAIISSTITIINTCLSLLPFPVTFLLSYVL